MATKKQLIIAATKLAVTLDEYDESIILDAPYGKQFTASGCHIISIGFANASGKAQAYQDGIDELKLGLIDCPSPENCNHCTDMA